MPVDHSTSVLKAIEDWKQGVEPVVLPLLRCPGGKTPALAGYKQSKLPCGHSVCGKCALACFNLSVVWAWSIQERLCDIEVRASSTFWFLFSSHHGWLASLGWLSLLGYAKVSKRAGNAPNALSSHATREIMLISDHVMIHGVRCRQIRPVATAIACQMPRWLATIAGCAAQKKAKHPSQRRNLMQQKNVGQSFWRPRRSRDTGASARMDNMFQQKCRTLSLYDSL